jgi:hypothetical protein
MDFDGLYWIILRIFNKKFGFEFKKNNVPNYLLRLGVIF